VLSGDWNAEYLDSQDQEGEEKSYKISTVKVIDAHWHPTSVSKGLDLTPLLAEIGCLRGSIDYPVVVVGGCAVYLDGPTPSDELSWNQDG
jgi:hypothetical protein